MLTKDYLPGGEFHVFRGTEWKFSLAQLRRSHVGRSADRTLAHQYCIRAPQMKQGTFDLRDIKQIDRFAAWDPDLRMGKLLHVLGAAFPRADDFVREVAPLVRTLHQEVQQRAVPVSGDSMALQGPWA